MLLFGCVANSQTIYLSRHAEKINDGTKDPKLTEQGQQRALNIAKMLSVADIERVYATNYHRTQLTAKPLADYLGVEVISYDPSDLTSFAAKLKNQTGNSWVVGHSNTTAELAELLSGKPVFKLTETDFDFLFQVIFTSGSATLNVLKSLPSNVLNP